MATNHQIDNFINGFLKCYLTFRGCDDSMAKVHDAFYLMSKKQERAGGAGQLLPIYTPPTYFGHFHRLDIPDYTRGVIPEFILYECDSNPNYDIINSYISTLPDIEFYLLYASDDLQRAGVCYSERKNRSSNNVTDFIKMLDLDSDDIARLMEERRSEYQNCDDNYCRGYRAVREYVDLDKILANLYKK